MARRKTAAAIRMDLALQGGGSHGAFTWGVLDRLLEDAQLGIEAISGTSAGALNAAVMASGWARGGRAGARAALAAFWADIGGQPGCFGGAAAPGLPAWAVMPPGPLPPALGGFNLDWHPGYAWFSQFMRIFSPYQFNPLGPNPLRAVLQRHVDADALRSGPLALFITATSVRTGQPRVFDCSDLSIDALLASACLPQLFKAVVIEGEAYWDGGYSGNPALWPLIYHSATLDLLLVQINPLSRPDLPDTPAEIADRVNELGFNAGLLGELRAIAFVQKLVADGRIDAGEYKSLRLHRIADEAGLAPLQPSSKLNTDWRFLQQLQALGRAAAERWLQAHRADIGRRGTLDIHRVYLDPQGG
jgi:NTE family protein